MKQFDYKVHKLVKKDSNVKIEKKAPSREENLGTIFDLQQPLDIDLNEFV